VLLGVGNGDANGSVYVNQLESNFYRNGNTTTFASGGARELDLSVATCQDDVDASAGYQVAVELSMANLGAGASGFAAFVDYDMGVFSYRGDLSSYSGGPYPLHITPIVQGDDGRLELDGSTSFGNPPATNDALLATLIFDVIQDCDPLTPAVTFETGGTFPSELSLAGVPLTTTLTNPSAYTLDDVNPILGACPANIVQSADVDVNSCLGAIVTWTNPGATDNCDPAPFVMAVPPSGSFFPVGTTLVTVSATDVCGNRSNCTFDVTVSPTNLLSVNVELIGVSAATNRCVRFTTDTCASADAVLNFTDHDANGATPVRAIQDIEIPCGEYVSVCLKDEQHSKWTTTTVSQTGVKYQMDNVGSLEGGDTDNDGDIDINDVTFFISEFGNLANAGGCAWDGTTRDADFSDNGAIGSEDYGFLTAGWLTTSNCVGCGLLVDPGNDPSGGARRAVRARTPRLRRVDFNRDGKIDVRDVKIFEDRHGFGNALSRAMLQRR
jgi:hypothetical protein